MPAKVSLELGMKAVQEGWKGSQEEVLQEQSVGVGSCLLQ